ncbi:MAG: hypothetical protein ABSA52_11275 [Candidatus Binatia bacterium]|jgi:hypothetical protein
MSLLGEVITHLEKQQVRCGLIGGEALAVHGVARATLDSDLLVANPDVLRDSFWPTFSPRAAVEIRRGDPDDPLAGVVRVHRRTEQTDIVVGRPWVRRILHRTIRVRVRGQELPVVDRTDLVLLKLFAGGPQDLLDVRLLLEVGGKDLGDQVERRLSGVPSEVGRTWRRVRSAPP